MRHIKYKITIVLGTLITVLVAYWLGVQAGSYLNDRQKEQIRAKGVQQTREVLDRMGTLKAGDTLKDFIFKDIDGNNRRLSELVSNRSMIIYVMTDCPSCLNALNTLAEVVSNEQDSPYFLVISDASPAELRELRDNFNLKCPVLFDQMAGFRDLYGLYTFPFTIVVGSQLVVEEINTSQLLPDDYQIVIDVNTY